MQLSLELLAPAPNKDIGIAAINCGADALYIGGPQFGARQAAGNSISDIAALAKYAHIYGSKVYVTINTILYDSELEAARRLMWELYDAGVDAFIVQDLGILKMDRPPLPLFASTQTFITTPQKAQFLESLGFQRLIVERQLSMEQVKAICSAVKCDVEFFVHGALCMSYSGQCYLSQRVAGRSANRGECGQPCRSKYDLVDGSGKVLLRDKHLLSLKDYRLDGRIAELVEAGISSFKIEGRLKNASYVKNVVRHYRAAIDSFLAHSPEYKKSSFGDLYGGFAANPDLTFGRGYTTAFVDGKRGKWMSDDSAKSMGEYIGEIASKQGGYVVIDTAKVLANGDGLAFSGREGIVGSRADLCEALRGGVKVNLKDTSRIKVGDKVYRNFNIKFEKELENNMPKRLMRVEVDYVTNGGMTEFHASCENGAKAEYKLVNGYPEAQKGELALSNMKQQFSKITEPYIFSFGEAHCDKFYFYPASFLNNVRRELARLLQCSAPQLSQTSQTSAPEVSAATSVASSSPAPFSLDYRANCANELSRGLYAECGIVGIAPAYELAPRKGVALMRSKYCLRHELGLCLKTPKGREIKAPLYLVNGNNRLRLDFDCERCEMSVVL